MTNKGDNARTRIFEESSTDARNKILSQNANDIDKIKIISIMKE